MATRQTRCKSTLYSYAVQHFTVAGCAALLCICVFESDDGNYNNRNVADTGWLMNDYSKCSMRQCVFFVRRSLYMIIQVLRPCCGPSVNIHGPARTSVQFRPDSSTTRPNPPIESVQLNPSVLTFVHTELGSGGDLHHSKALPNPYAFQFIANTFNNSKFC